MSGPSKALKADFIEDYYRFATPEDVPETDRGREALALSHLDWGIDRDAGEIKVRVFNPDSSDYGSSHTVIETITDDSPFIIGSLTMQLNALSQGIDVKLHSVLNIERNEDGWLEACRSGDARESWTHFEIPRILESKRLRDIEQQLRATLEDVRIAVTDWPQMTELLRGSGDLLRRFGQARDAEESSRLLDWLADHHFTVLGSCSSADTTGRNSLGLLRDRKRRAALRTGTRRSTRPKTSLTITKAPIRSTVHRPALLDDIRVDDFAPDGTIRGEIRFVGLFTSTAYNESPRDIPLLRSKVSEVLKRSGLDPTGHRGKALVNILETFPRDELIQSGVEELKRISVGILNIEERRKIRLFVSESAYRDFFSCLVYLPRDGYSSAARSRVETLLRDAFDGDVVDSRVTISESSLARLSLTIQRRNLRSRKPDLGRLELQLADVAAAWKDRARLALLDAFPEEKALALHDRFAGSFPIAYQENAGRERLSRDFATLARMVDDNLAERFELDASGQKATFSVFLSNRTLPLYVAHPILENMGVRLLEETSFDIDVAGSSLRIQDFVIESAHGETLESEDLADRFKTCFSKVLDGTIENDGFNQLVVSAALSWRRAVILRTYCKYLLQCRAQFSQSYIIETLRRHPEMVQAYADLFCSYFDPELSDNERERRIASHQEAIRAGIDRSVNLDEDRILRMFSAAIQATLRTNFYQRTDGQMRPCLSIKLDPTRIPEVPEPKPKFEIFVYAKEVEGVHLRGGDIARGGIRWSDRREDFRTEVLGLMKAQQVKNTVIVPAGAKGGFVLKSPPADPTALREHVAGCYRVFLRGLLDLTDNIVDDRTVTPDLCVCRDGPDPYLVVAADKGTATFSDTANAVAAEYGFWLGDAFASGGSAGYDHKKMGITARGAWESVKRHFREIGSDTDRDPFTVVGIGDMSGDVFGNGMLLSRQIRLIAAFNHRHIFIDPDPDPVSSFEERKRLFEMSRSGWDDYDAKRISRGGGVFDRTRKSIRLSAEARKVLGITDAELAPPALIRAILSAPVDLLFNGGIGTYVRASTEANSDAADPVNDPVRIDGKTLRAKIVAEGGNLGLTQRGRIEYALAGGRINTDFIDNSAGVDSSDREVNIKILLSDAIRREELAKGRRNALLASMTDEVAELVLASNYAQTQALSMMAAKAYERIGEHARLIRILESRGLLNRALEDLPGEEEIEERKRAGHGFTRPELAVTLSYAKIELYESLVATDIPDEAYCQSEVFAYFPKRLGKRFEKSIRSHRLRREIAAMLISSSMVNRMGPYFAIRAENDTGADTADVARAYAIVRGLFDTRDIWRSIESFDDRLPAQVQYECFFECSRMLRRAVYWFLHRRNQNRIIEKSVDRKRAQVSAVVESLSTVLCGWSRRSYERDTRTFEELGVPPSLAERIASLRLATQVLDIAELSAELDIDPLEVARLHFELGRGLRLDWLREQIEDLEVEGHWSAMARGTLRETLGREHRSLLRMILRQSDGGDYSAGLAGWLAASSTDVNRLKRTLDEMQASGPLDFATLSIALKEIGRLH